MSPAPKDAATVRVALLGCGTVGSALVDMIFDPANSPAGSSIDLRFEMDTLVLMHSCPHPMNPAADYPRKPVGLQFRKADPVAADDFCLNFRPENGRGFQNNEIYHLCARTGE